MEDETFEDLRTVEDFATGVELPLPDAEDFKPPLAAGAMKPERGEAHREAQRKGALNQWKAKDRRDGVPLPAKSTKAPPASKRTAIQALLLKQVTESLPIKRALEEYVCLTIQDLGGWEHLTSGQKGMLVCQRSALLIILACEEVITTAGKLIDDDGRPHPLFTILRDYMSVFRQGQIALGLGLRSRMPRSDNVTVERVMAEYAAKKSERPLLVPEKPAKKATKDKAG